MATFLPKNEAVFLRPLNIRSYEIPAYKFSRLSSAIFYVTEERKEGTATGHTHPCLLHGAICAFAGTRKWKCACMQVYAWGIVA